MNRCSEAPLPENRLQLIANAADAAAHRMGVAEAEPDAVIDAVDAFVYAWQGGRRLFGYADEDRDDVPFEIGPLWGQQLVRRFGWAWRNVTFHDHGDTQAWGVLSPDRSLAIYPIHFLIGALNDPGVDATIALSFNMLDAGKVIGVGPGAYANVMDRVHRLIPRLPPKGAPAASSGGPRDWLRRAFGGK